MASGVFFLTKNTPTSDAIEVLKTIRPALKRSRKNLSLFGELKRKAGSQYGLKGSLASPGGRRTKSSGWLRIFFASEGRNCLMCCGATDDAKIFNFDESNGAKLLGTPS
jgi:hypothetical protein